MSTSAAKQALVTRARANAALIRKLERDRQSNLDGGLLHFVHYFWHVLEPNQPLVEGRVLDAICQHLEAVTKGQIRRLLINVSPGSMKSLLCNVFWPLWQWSAAGLPATRFISFSYAAHLTQRDNARMRDVIHSAVFQELWGHCFRVTEDGKVKLGNSETGWKLASSVEGVATGERADVLILDDPHNIAEGESEAIRKSTVRWVRESMSSRLNNMDTGVIVCIMQRVHEDDVTVAILDADLGHDHLCIPMQFDRTRQGADVDRLARLAHRGGRDSPGPERFSARTWSSPIVAVHFRSVRS